MKDMVITGTAWVITDPETGRLIDNIDTDMIYHNAHLAVTEVEKMGTFTFGNLKGWEDFPRKAKPGDIVVAGVNFGSGSSRQHAVDCFKALGISVIIAGSYGAIYKRNAINSGLPVITFPEVAKSGIKTGDVLKVNLETGVVENITTSKILNGVQPFSPVQADIYKAGNLFEYAKSLAV